MSNSELFQESKYLRPRLALENELPAWRKWYSMLLPLCFILNGYASGVSGLSLGAAVISFFVGMSFLFMLGSGLDFSWGRDGCYAIPLLFAGYLLVANLFAVLTLGNDQLALREMLVNLAKIFVWSVGISITCYMFLDYSLFKKWLLRVAIASTLYLIMQYIAWYGGSFFLPNIFDLPTISPYVEEYVDYTRYISYAYRSFRPSAFFGEPAFYSNVVLVGLAMHMFDSAEEGWTRRGKLIAALLSVGLLFSTSTSGIYALFLLLIFYFLTAKQRNKLINISLAGLSALIVLLLLNLQNDLPAESLGAFGQTFLNAVSKPLRFMDIGRGGKSFEYLRYLTGINQWIGVGFGNTFNYLATPRVYINTFTGLVFSVGYFGVAVFALFIASLLKGNRDNCSIYLIGMYTIKIFSSGIMFNLFGILFLSIAIYRNKYKYMEVKPNG